MAKPQKKSIAKHFRNINVGLFVLTFVIMAAVMSVAFSSVMDNLTYSYAASYVVSSAEVLSARISNELNLLCKSIHSEAVVDWMKDENDPAKKETAYEEISNIVSELHCYNLYVGLEKTRREYRVDDKNADKNLNFASLDFLLVDELLSRSDPDDSWYFDCAEAEEDYQISVGIDLFLQRKRVWLDHKVIENGETLGVICTGFEFSHIVGELFSRFDDNNMRGFIVDKNGVIQMDSALINDKDFLYDKFEESIESVVSDKDALDLIYSRLSGNTDYWNEASSPEAKKLTSGNYRYMTIYPIDFTDWHVIIFSGTPSLFNISVFVPSAAALLFLLIAFAIITSFINFRLIFLPIGRLNSSFAMLKENHKGEIYGTGRDDEFGELSRTIQDLFTKTNIDALTGIYNRRFMENNLQYIMENLARSNGLLSVIMLDIDYFKKYNDTYGHDQGDVCLKEVSKTIAASVTRQSDFSARYGGEEFIIVLPNTDETGLGRVAAKLLDNVYKLNIPHEKNQAAPCVTVSAGGTTGRVFFNQRWEEYIKRADEALYKSKKNGRNQYTFMPFSEN